MKLYYGASLAWSRLGQSEKAGNVSIKLNETLGLNG